MPTVGQHLVPGPVVEEVGRRVAGLAAGGDDVQAAGGIVHHRLLDVVPGGEPAAICRPSRLGRLRELLPDSFGRRPPLFILGRRGGARQS